MKFHRNHTCTKTEGKKDFVSNPFGEMIAALSLLAETLDTPFQNMNALADSTELAPAAAARQALEAALGQIPLPSDHPDYTAIAGGIMEALGAVENVQQAYGNVLNEAGGATAACQAAKDSVQAVITGFQSGMGN